MNQIQTTLSQMTLAGHKWKPLREWDTLLVGEDGLPDRDT